jgi:DNA-binding protein Alba
MSEEIQTETQVKEQTEESNEKEVKNTDSNTDKKLSEENEQGKDNIIFVGVKPFMNYVTGVVMQFQNKGQEEVIVSARGKFISKAVDVTEVARRTFLKDEDIKIKGIKISSEQFENKEGKRIFVSTIEIRLIK